MTAILQALYVVSTIGLAVVGFNSLVLSIVYLLHRKSGPQPLEVTSKHWPHVLVQLPIYNERHVVERLIAAVSAIDYPVDKLVIQVLDDSNDETTFIAERALRGAAASGFQIDHIRRQNRTGFKAGALSDGLEASDAEFIAVFDADFVPAPDFLKRTIPYFLKHPEVGFAQARWSHLNADHSLITRAQALALDAHFVVEQTARNQGGLLMNFSGTAGVWRRDCIQSSGGWQHDTLSEDIDLSYRAQLEGWRGLYLLETSVDAEIPPLMLGFKRQQARWATGTVQCLRKLGGKVLNSPHLNPWVKVQAMIHLGGYLIHPLILIILILTLPLAVLDGLRGLPLAGLGLAIIGPPVQSLLAQRHLHRKWLRRLAYFPILMLVGVGLAVNNTQAVFKGVRNGAIEFQRTPKFENVSDAWTKSPYVLPADGSTWIEIGLAIYAAISAFLTWSQLPGLSLFLFLYAGGFMLVGLSSLAQSRQRMQITQRRSMPAMD